MGRRFWILSLTCRTFRRNSCGAGGWRKRKRVPDWQIRSRIMVVCGRTAALQSRLSLRANDSTQRSALRYGAAAVGGGYGRTRALFLRVNLDQPVEECPPVVNGLHADTLVQAVNISA